MLRSYLLVFLVITLACSNLFAEDYLIRIETIGFRDKQVSRKQPVPKTLESIEVVARVNQSFHATSTFGDQKISISGKLEQETNGDFCIRINFSSIEESQIVIPGLDGQKLPISSSGVKTKTRFKLNTPTTLGGINSTSTEGGKETSTSTQSILTVVKYAPEDD